MSDFIDILEGAKGDAAGEDEATSRKFLMIWFRCCNVYGRLYRNVMRTAYEGQCPRCGARVRAGIGPGGTSRRMFEAR